MSLDLAPNVSPEVLTLLPSFRIHLLAFSGAKVGFGSRSIDELRRRVVARARTALAGERDLARAPAIQAFQPLLGPRRPNAHRDLPVHGALLRGVARGEALMVQNDAQDLADLLTLAYQVPAYVWDRALIHPPIAAVLAGGDAATGGAALAGSLVLTDRRGLLGGLRSATSRGRPTERTREVLLAVLDPGTPRALDPDELGRRTANWFGAVLGATLASAEVAPAAVP